MKSNDSELLPYYAPNLVNLGDFIPIRDHIPEGYTIIIEAPQRWGKTLSMIMWEVWALQQGRTIFSNIQLAFPHVPLEFDELELADGKSRFWNGFIGIDELNFYFDCRRSLTSGNVKASTFLLQQKKQGCILAGTTHSVDSLDFRLTDNFDYLIRPEVFPKHPEAPQIVKWCIENGPQQQRLHRDITLDCRPFLGLYDTYAIYDPYKNLKRRQKDDEDFKPIKQRIKL